MIGDILFLSTTFPFRYALSWWQHTFSHSETILDSEIDQTGNGTPPEHGISDISDAAQNPNPQVLANPPIPSLRKQPSSLGVAAAAPRRPAETRHASATVRTRRQVIDSGMDPKPVSTLVVLQRHSLIRYIQAPAIEEASQRSNLSRAINAAYASIPLQDLAPTSISIRDPRTRIQELAYRRKHSPESPTPRELYSTTRNRRMA